MSHKIFDLCRIKSVNVLSGQKNTVINTKNKRWRWQALVINQAEWSDVIPTYYLQLFQGMAFWRPQGKRTMLVTEINPAIGSGSVLLGIARLCAGADRGRRAMPDLLDDGSSSFFPGGSGRWCLCFFWGALLEWHIFNLCHYSAGAQV